MIKRDESGYSMVEVLVAITILLIAIIPMFAMFDVGLRTATMSSNYDKARSLAEKQAELAQSADYTWVRHNFPSGCSNSGTPNTTITGCKESADDEGNSPYENLEFSVEKTYLRLPDNPGSDITLQTSSSDEGMIRVIIKVSVEGNAEPIFTTTGVVVE